MMTENFLLDSAQDERDLRQILALQQKNLPKNIDPATAREQGFVTVEHDFETLSAMNSPHGHTVARDPFSSDVIGYALTMLPVFGEKVEVLKPMFALFEKIEIDGRRLSSLEYVVMGQICVDEKWRGRGVFDGLYRKMRERFAGVFEVIVTEVAVRNARSMRAHERVGFRTVHRYDDPVSGEDWAILAMFCQV